jgi:hypothetical protein
MHYISRILACPMESLIAPKGKKARKLAAGQIAERHSPATAICDATYGFWNGGSAPFNFFAGWSWV